MSAWTGFDQDFNDAVPRPTASSTFDDLPWQEQMIRLAAMGYRLEKRWPTMGGQSVQFYRPGEYSILASFGNRRVVCDVPGDWQPPTA